MQHEHRTRYRCYLLDAVQVTAVGLSALALAPAGSHLFDMPRKFQLAPADYLVVQRVEQGWMLLAAAAVLAIVAIGFHTYLVRRNATAFGWSSVALVGIGAAQIVLWTVAYPISAATDGWKVAPVDFDTARQHWEYATATAGVLMFGALLALVRSIEASRPFASISILQSIERDAAVRAARTRALSADNGLKQLFEAAQNRAA